MRTLLAGARIFDTATGQWSEPSDVLLAGQRIASVSKSTAVAMTQRADFDALIDCSDKFLVPGLIDLHAHVTLEANSHYEIRFSFGEPNRVSELRAVQNLAIAAQHGVCLVRDLGGAPLALSAIRDMIRAEALCLPDLITSGRPLCVEQGHGSSFGQTLEPNLKLTDFMLAHKAAGHEWVKIMNGPETWPKSRLAALCDAAHEHNLKVAVHAFRDDACWMAIEAGADTIEHCLLASQSMIDAASTAGVHFVATALAAKSSLAAAFVRTQLPQELQYLEEWSEYLKSRRATHLASGVPLLIGTDGGCAPCHMSDIIGEMVELQSWGYKAEDLLRWSTQTAALVVGRSHELGQISRGSLASLIVLEADPTIDLRSLYQPYAVYLRGRPTRNAFGGAHA